VGIAARARSATDRLSALADARIVFLTLKAEGHAGHAEAQRHGLADEQGHGARIHFAGERLATVQRNPQGNLLPRDSAIPRLRRKSTILRHTVGQQRAIAIKTFTPRRSRQESIAGMKHGSEVGGAARSGIERNAAGLILADLNRRVLQGVHGHAFGEQASRQSVRRTVDGVGDEGDAR
jgi:hypothetical protein